METNISFTNMSLSRTFYKGEKKLQNYSETKN